MAVINLETRTLRVISTTGLRVAGTTRADSNTANGLTPASMSPGRHPAPHFPRIEVQPRSRRYWVDVRVDVDSAGKRAGRSGGLTGIRVGRIAALAGFAGGNPGSAVVWSKRHAQGLRAAFVSQEFPQRPCTVLPWAERRESAKALVSAKLLSKRGTVQAAWFMPRGGTLPAMTRGKS